MGTLGARDAITRYRNSCHVDVIEGVVAAVRAYDGFPTSLEMVVLGILHGVDASFDAATDILSATSLNRYFVGLLAAFGESSLVSSTKTWCASSHSFKASNLPLSHAKRLGKSFVDLSGTNWTSARK